jgi:hypothetical protein
MGSKLTGVISAILCIVLPCVDGGMATGSPPPPNTTIHVTKILKGWKFSSKPRLLGAPNGLKNNNLMFIN